MALFNFFNVPKHRSFNYQPRYYDPKREELEGRIKAAESHNDVHIIGSHIRGKIQKAVYEGRKSSMSPMISRIIILVSILAMMAVVYFFADALSNFFK
ncbi:hypothetical protein SDC9_46884 [bioreactor metagenome]|jgi:hypothetical protein|uniref:Riboflavin synthase subunit beta n=1 Tax=bioreactor metagenome TaxID=1076179 RepID=A0A644WA10_9ZZZZ|nr:hypothetical protein [Bacteroidales bacterium]MBP8678473.1 hypothetical protein [Bacteroidales bacterium]MBP9585088.1 hypothetical protein [Bacteroidales bacterium]MBP9979153.1 hypothetical protein [Bacteroidales bacterium]